MRWRGRRESSNVEDRRGAGGASFPGGFGRGGGMRIPIGGRRGGGLSLSGIIVLVVLFFALRACGIDPLEILAGGDMGAGGVAMQGDRPADDETVEFVSVVLAETEDVWNGIFEAGGEAYEEPKLLLFTRAVQSACGTASSAMGPFYCPDDRKVYLDLDFFDQLSRSLGAGGDFARAYVIAHEVGHHVQNLIGVLPRFNEMRRDKSKAEANRMSVRVELQADCFAGIWAHYTERKGLLEAGDIDEALNAAKRIGDDALQRRSQGYVMPDSFTHGTSEQRRKWLKRGMDSGRMDACNTFADAG